MKNTDSGQNLLTKKVSVAQGEIVSPLYVLDCFLWKLCVAVIQFSDYAGSQIAGSPYKTNLKNHQLSHVMQ